MLFKSLQGDEIQFKQSYVVNNILEYSIGIAILREYKISLINNKAYEMLYRKFRLLYMWIIQKPFIKIVNFQINLYSWLSLSSSPDKHAELIIIQFKSFKK